MPESDDSESRVRVFIRPRPPTVEEAKLGSCISLNGNSIIVQKDQTTSNQFHFDAVFPLSASQQDLYDKVGRPVVSDVLNGINGAILVYGQTGTGKTYTLGILDNLRTTNLEDAGIIPKALSELYSTIESKRKTKEISKYSIKLSFLQLYLETVQDLHHPTDNLSIREHPERGIYVANLSDQECPSLSSAIDFINKGLSNRIVAPTLLNVTSSRAHTVLTVNVKTLGVSEDKIPVKRSAKLVFTDLAGSERVKKSLSRRGLEENYQKRLAESRAINTSLAALGNVISILSCTNQSTISHIPYRDSKLTRILQPVFSGHCRVSVVCTVCESKAAGSESLSTLLFAERCAGVRIVPVLNESVSSNDPVYVIKQLTEEVRRLKKELAEVKSRKEGQSSGVEYVKSESGDVVDCNQDLMGVVGEVYSALVSQVSDLSVRSNIRRQLQERSLYQEVEAEVRRSQENSELFRRDEMKYAVPSKQIESTSVIQQNYPIPEPNVSQSPTVNQLTTEDLINGRAQVSRENLNIVSNTLTNLVSTLAVHTTAAEDSCLEFRDEIVHLLKFKQNLEAEQENWRQVLKSLLLKNGEQRSQIQRQCLIIEKAFTENNYLRESLSQSESIIVQSRRQSKMPNFSVINAELLPSVTRGIRKAQTLWRIKRYCRKMKKESSVSKARSRAQSNASLQNSNISKITNVSTVFAKPSPLSSEGPLHKATQEILNAFQYTLDYLLPNQRDCKGSDADDVTSQTPSLVSSRSSRLRSFSSWTDTCTVPSRSSTPSHSMTFPSQSSRFLTPALNVPPKRAAELLRADSDSSESDGFEQIAL
ncbi:hypothetical protein GEMRC1_011405 [Eukaryota sp. GEM-RC1]